MKIRYRSQFSGTFISAKDARLKKFAKAVISELVDTKTKKVVGKSKGYFTQPKKLARVILPQIKLKPAKRYTPPPLDIPEDQESDEDDWNEYADEYPALDALDELEDLEDEDEWYENH